MNYQILLAVVFFTVSFIAGWLSVKFLKAHKSLQLKIAEISKTNLMQDLELATSEQLIKELRTRKTFPFVMVYASPQEDENTKGVSIEVTGMQLPECAKILSLASYIATLESKKMGFEMPDFPMNLFPEKQDDFNQDYPKED